MVGRRRDRAGAIPAVADDPGVWSGTGDVTCFGRIDRSIGEPPCARRWCTTEATISIWKRFDASSRRQGAEDCPDETNQPAIERPTRESRSFLGGEGGTGTRLVFFAMISRRNGHSSPNITTVHTAEAWVAGVDLEATPRPRTPGAGASLRSAPATHSSSASQVWTNRSGVGREVTRNASKSSAPQERPILPAGRFMKDKPCRSTAS
jgi:hypothetical protein